MTQSSNLGAVPTGTGATVRAAFNTAFQAVVTESEGTGAPSPTYPFMLWRNDTDEADQAPQCRELGVGDGRQLRRHRRPDGERRYRRRLGARFAVDQHRRQQGVRLLRPGGRRGGVERPRCRRHGTQAFGTITVSGQSDVVADAAPDTLTLVGSNGVAITTTPGTDTVTFAPTYGPTPIPFARATTAGCRTRARLSRTRPATSPAAPTRSSSTSSRRRPTSPRLTPRPRRTG